MNRVKDKAAMAMGSARSTAHAQVLALAHENAHVVVTHVNKVGGAEAFMDSGYAAV